MYAKNLAHLLHEILASGSPFDETLTRFERLRGCALLPRGRENAAKRLTDTEVANAILGFVPSLPGWAGHASLILGGLCAVGGGRASFESTTTLRETIAAILASDLGCRSLVGITFSIERDYGSEEYHARAVFDGGGIRKVVSYVSHMATTLLAEGAEERYDHDKMRAISGRQLTLGQDFFLRLRRDLTLSRHLDLPLKTDWREYETEEEKNAFHKRLGARQNSRFLNLAVDTQAAWPSEPTRMKFEGYQFVLFPRTKENSHSISIDLATERLSAEEARTLLNRFLSLLAWCDDQYAVLGFGWSGNPVPVPVSLSRKGFSTTSQWLFSRTLPTDQELRQRLAYYREGLNAREAGLVTFAVLSFFKVFEVRAASKRGDPNPTIEWIRDAFPLVESTLQPETIRDFHIARDGIEVEKYISQNCRVATAHASAQVPSDADSSLEIQRLYLAAEVIHALARHCLRTQYRLSNIHYTDEFPD